MALTKVTTGTRETCEVPQLKGESAAILKVTAKWCKPCQRIQSDFLRICSANAISAYCMDIDEVGTEADESREFLNQLEIASLPTFILFKLGEEHSRKCGASISSITELCDSVKEWKLSAESGEQSTKK